MAAAHLIAAHHAAVSPFAKEVKREAALRLREFHSCLKHHSLKTCTKQLFKGGK